MIVVYPDTNAFYADHLMGKETSQAFLGLLTRGSVEVWLSPVVVAEAQRQTREGAEKFINEVSGTLGNIRRTFPLDEEAASSFTASLSAGLTAQGDRALKPLLDHNASRVLPWSGVSAQALVQRELDRRKPVLETGKDQSIGLRDVVIWHDFIEVLGRMDGDDYVVFVSNDKGFSEGGEFHSNLVEEIEHLGTIPIDNVKLVSTLGEATLELRRFAKLVTERDEALIDALVDWVYGLDSYDWEGYPTANDAVVGSTLPEGMKDIEVVVVPMMSVLEVGDGNPARCHATNELIFRARMSALDYMEWTDDRLSILGRTPNTDEVAVEFKVEADVRAEIEYNPDGRYATVAEASVSWDV